MNASSTLRSFGRELGLFVLVALFVVLPFRLFVAQPFIVSGESMSPTFENGEYLVVDELSYRFSAPGRGDVVVFRFPPEPSRFLIKRIIGLPGETVSFENGRVRVANADAPEGTTLDEPYLSGVSTTPSIPVTLGADEYFVLGDNRPASSDSRVWGVLPRDLLVGRALARLLPVARAEILPGAITPDSGN